MVCNYYINILLITETWILQYKTKKKYNKPKIVIQALKYNF